MPRQPDRPLRLLYFAWVREKTGRSEEIVTPPGDVATIADLIAWLQGRGPEYKAAFANAGVVRAAIDQRHAKAESSIADAHEIAFFPPVTGG